MQYNIATTFETARGFIISKYSGLFPKGWFSAKPKTILNAAKADTASLLLIHDVDLPAAGMASWL